MSTMILATIVAGAAPAAAAYVTAYSIGGGLCLVGAAVLALG